MHRFELRCTAWPIGLLERVSNLYVTSCRGSTASTIVSVYKGFTIEWKEDMEEEGVEFWIEVESPEDEIIFKLKYGL